MARKSPPPLSSLHAPPGHLYAGAPSVEAPCGALPPDGVPLHPAIGGAEGSCMVGEWDLMTCSLFLHLRLCLLTCVVSYFNNLIVRH